MLKTPAPFLEALTKIPHVRSKFKCHICEYASAHHSATAFHEKYKEGHQKDKRTTIGGFKVRHTNRHSNEDISTDSADDSLGRYASSLSDENFREIPSVWKLSLKIRIPVAF